MKSIKLYAFNEKDGAYGFIRKTPEVRKRVVDILSERMPEIFSLLKNETIKLTIYLHDKDCNCGACAKRGREHTVITWLRRVDSVWYHNFISRNPQLTNDFPDGWEGLVNQA